MIQRTYAIAHACALRVKEQVGWSQGIRVIAVAMALLFVAATGQAIWLPGQTSSNVHRSRAHQVGKAVTAAAKPAPAAAQPAAAAPAPAPQPPTVPQVIQTAFTPLGPDAVNWALRVSSCESEYNPQAVNSSTGAAGLFQFLPSTWASSPYAASSPFDPTANAQAAAWLYQTSGPSQWQCS